jgi:hypothetical protein
MSLALEVQAPIPPLHFKCNGPKSPRGRSVNGMELRRCLRAGLRPQDPGQFLHGAHVPDAHIEPTFRLLPSRPQTRHPPSRNVEGLGASPDMKLLGSTAQRRVTCAPNEGAPVGSPTGP